MVTATVHALDGKQLQALTGDTFFGAVMRQAQHLASKDLKRALRIYSEQEGWHTVHTDGLFASDHRGPIAGAIWQCVHSGYDCTLGQYASLTDFLRSRPNLKLWGASGRLYCARTGQVVLRLVDFCLPTAQLEAELALIGLANGGLDAIPEHPEPGKLRPEHMS